MKVTARAGLNALKRGDRARTIDVMFLLPREDPKQLEERIQTGLDDWQPRNAIESKLVRRWVRLCWIVERGERFESLHLAHHFLHREFRPYGRWLRRPVQSEGCLGYGMINVSFA